MKIRNRTNFIINAIGVALVLFGVVLKKSPGHHPYLLCASYLLFFALWQMSLHWRVVPRKPRKCLVCIASLEFFWILIRTVKFELLTSVAACRYAWYLYYLPILMIPVCCALLVLSIGKPEDYRFPKAALILPTTANALLFLVLTNDLHSLVFHIPPGKEGLSVGVYSYGIGYAVIMVCVGFCVVTSFVVLFLKCRVPGNRMFRLIPLFPLLIGGTVCALYAMGIEQFFGYKVDISVFICFCTTATLEACIQSGLIMTNTGYGELFRMSGISSVITDDRLRPLLASDSYALDPAGAIYGRRKEEAAKTPVTREDGVRISSAPLKAGRIFWKDDLSELNGILARLSELSDFLQDKNEVIRETYDYQKKEQQLIEKNRLYNRILTHTGTEIRQYRSLIEELDRETDTDKIRRLAIKIAFISAFIKRRDNLIFLGEADEKIAAAELSYCIEESLSTLRLTGTDCFCSSDLKKPLAFDVISKLYESFYQIIFELIGNLLSVCVYLIEENGEASLVMRIAGGKDADLMHVCSSRIRAVKENEEWVVTVCE